MAAGSVTSCLSFGARKRFEALYFIPINNEGNFSAFCHISDVLNCFFVDLTLQLHVILGTL